MYWLTSLPLVANTTEDTWRTLNACTGEGDLTHNYRFELPTGLRVGSLDALMVLSDDLARVNVMVEGVVNKIRRQASELAPEQALTVNNRPVASFLMNFSWNEAKYPLRKPLADIMDELADSATAVDDDLKHKIVEYQGLKQQVQAASRRAGGSLAVKDARSVLSPADIVDTENLLTVVAVVPQYTKKDFLASYETFCDMVVPRSGAVVEEDKDYALVRVVLFRRFSDDFRQVARTKGCQVKEVAAVDEEAAATAAAAPGIEELQAALVDRKAELAAWCATSYGDAFAAWIHICAVRLFVESVLRYGLPPRFLGAVLEPVRRQEGKARKALAETFGTHGAQFWGDDGDGPLGAAAGADRGDMHPYVSFTLDLDTA